MANAIPSVMSPDDRMAQPNADLAALKLVLNGESAIDMGRLWFADRDSVDRFLRLTQFDPDNPLDVARLCELHQEALDYLTEVHRYRVPLEVAEPAEIQDLLLLCGRGPKRSRQYACMLLKVMHILHHLSGQELLFNTPISEAQLLDRLNERVFAVIDRMRATGIEVLELSSGRKTRTSFVTKLLAKRSTLASQIFDRLRFALTLQSRVDVVRAILYLSRNLFPFNFVVPEQSKNGIVTLEDVAAALELPLENVREYWSRHGDPAAYAAAPTPPNEFSGQSYRCVNFVTDIPLRIDDIAPNAIPAVVFVQTEIQVVDAATDRANNRGENSHGRYKKRQLARVRGRLEAEPAEPAARPGGALHASTIA